MLRFSRYTEGGDMEGVRFANAQDAEQKFWEHIGQGIGQLIAGGREWKDDFDFMIVRSLMGDRRVVGVIKPGEALMQLQQNKRVEVQFKVPGLNWLRWLHQATIWMHTGKRLEEFEKADSNAVEEWENRVFLQKSGKVLGWLFAIIAALSFIYSSVKNG